MFLWIKILRKLLLPVGFILIIGSIWVFYSSKHDTPFKRLQSFLQRKPLIIEQSPLIVLQLRSLAQLVCARYMDEIVVHKTKDNDSELLKLLKNKSEIVLIIKGSVHAGYDLSQLDSSAVQFSNDTLFLKLGKPQILDIIANPSDMETFIESGEWSHEEVLKLQSQAQDMLLQRGIEQNIIMLAEKNGKAVIKTFLNKIGISNIIFT